MRLGRWAWLAAMAGTMGLAAFGACAQPVYNPANGHYYERVLQNGVTWLAASRDAENRTHAGMSGHLATVTTPAEQAFINAHFGNIPGVWLGGVWSNGLDGDWRWVTGETWGFTAFHPGQPNNLTGYNAYLMLNPTGAAWSDSVPTDTAKGYIVEYSRPWFPIGNGIEILTAEVNGSSSMNTATNGTMFFGATGFVNKKSAGGSTGGGFGAEYIRVTSDLRVWDSIEWYAYPTFSPFGVALEQRDEGYVNVLSGEYFGQVNGRYTVRMDRDYVLAKSYYYDAAHLQLEPLSGISDLAAGQIRNYRYLTAGDYATESFQFFVDFFIDSTDTILEPLPYPCLRTGWRQLESLQSPNGRTSGAIAYDPNRGAVVMLDLATPPKLWAWNNGWTLLSSSGPTTARAAYAMAYDRNRGRLVVFGGQRVTGSTAYLSELWEWNGTSWTLRSQPTPRPAARRNADFVFDPNRGTCVLIGGLSNTTNFQREAWEWNGTAWSRLPDLPADFHAESACFDPIRGSVVAIDGNGRLACFRLGMWVVEGTFIANGLSWSNALRFDPRTNGLILFSGGTYCVPFELVAGQWTLMSMRGPSENSVLGGAAFDENRNSFILTAANSWSGVLGEHRRASAPDAQITHGDLLILRGQPIEIGAAFTSAGSTSIEWRRNGTILADGGRISGATTPNLLIQQASAADAGTYTFTVTDECAHRVLDSVTVQVLGCPGDLNGDSIVDDSDFQIFVRSYDLLDCLDPAMPMGCVADLTADAFVDDADFSVFVAAYDSLLCP